LIVFLETSTNGSRVFGLAAVFFAPLVSSRADGPGPSRLFPLLDGNPICLAYAALSPLFSRKRPLESKTLGRVTTMKFLIGFYSLGLASFGAEPVDYEVTPSDWKVSLVRDEGGEIEVEVWREKKAQILR